MKFKTFSLVVLATLYFILAAAPLVLAQENPLKDAADQFTNLDQQQLIDIFLNIIRIILVIVGLVAVGVVLWAAFQFITAGGDPGKAESARKTLTWALVGVAVAILSFSIVTFTQSLLDSGSGSGTNNPSPTGTPGTLQPSSCTTSSQCSPGLRCIGGRCTLPVLP